MSRNNKTCDTSTTDVQAESAVIRSAIQRVAAGPELSKSISRDETRQVCGAMLDGRMDPVQSAAFLIGLRMKRETNDEFRGAMDALLERTSSISVNSPRCVGLADPYNGFNRTVQASLAILPVLAACGVPAYSHGVEACSPKYGVTHSTTLQALGGRDDLPLAEAGARLDDPAIGWAYIDQQVFCPALYGLNDFRRLLIKRPAYSTAEVMLTPIKGKDKTHLITGYVHNPYRDIYIMLAEHCGLDSMLLVKGTEGGVIPSLRANVRVERYLNTYIESNKNSENNESEESNEHSSRQTHEFDLSSLNMQRTYRAEDIPDTIPAAKFDEKRPGAKWDIDALSQYCAQKCTNTLAGEHGPTRDAVVLGGALALWHVGESKIMSDAISMAENAIDSGAAKKHFDAGLRA